VLPFSTNGQPWHSSQYQALPEIYVQNASLEIAWCRVVTSGRTIAGDVVTPFFTAAYEGFDINRPEDWQAAETLVASGAAALPRVSQPPFPA
jgi:CMP-N,N'-diacetyllegionaminic acid synthase